MNPLIHSFIHLLRWSGAHRGHIHTHIHTNRLFIVTNDPGRKLENPERIHTDTGRAWKLHTEFHSNQTWDLLALSSFFISSQKYMMKLVCIISSHLVSLL